MLPLGVYFDAIDVPISSEGWSGNWRSYSNGNADVVVEPRDRGCRLSLAANARGQEVSMKMLSPHKKTPMAWIKI